MTTRPAILYGLLGMKTYFYYIPLMFVAYASHPDRSGLAKVSHSQHRLGRRDWRAGNCPGNFRKFVPESGDARARTSGTGRSLQGVPVVGPGLWPPVVGFRKRRPVRDLSYRGVHFGHGHCRLFDLAYEAIPKAGLSLCWLALAWLLCSAGPEPLRVSWREPLGSFRRISLGCAVAPAAGASAGEGASQILYRWSSRFGGVVLDLSGASRIPPCLSIPKP